MRVLLIGSVVANGGDAAIMAAQVATMRRVFIGCDVAMHDLHPPVARRIFPDVEVLPFTYNVVTTRDPGKINAVKRRANEARVLAAAQLMAAGRGSAARALVTRAELAQLKSLQTADLVAYTGGTTLIETYSLRSKWFELRLAEILGRTLILLPQSLGPFVKEENQTNARSTVAYAAAVFLREEKSRGHLAAIGCDMSRVHVMPDVVFGLMAREALPRLAEGTVPEKGARVAISVRDCRPFFKTDRESNHARYVAAVRDLATHLVRERAAVVTFVSTCQGVPEYWTDDSHVADEIAGGLPDNVAVTVDHDNRSPLALRDELARYDLLVATRLHAAILGFDAGTPVLPIAYEFKTREVMVAHGLGEFVTDVATVTGPELVDSCERLLADLPGYRPALAQALDVTVGHTHDAEAMIFTAASR